MGVAILIISLRWELWQQLLPLPETNKLLWINFTALNSCSYFRSLPGLFEKRAMTGWTKIDTNCICIIAQRGVEDGFIIRVISRCFAQSLL